MGTLALCSTSDFSPEKNELPHVVIEPTALCVLCILLRVNDVVSSGGLAKRDRNLIVTLYLPSLPHKALGSH